MWNLEVPNLRIKKKGLYLEETEDIGEILEVLIALFTYLIQVQEAIGDGSFLNLSYLRL